MTLTPEQHELACLLRENQDDQHTLYGILSPRRAQALADLLPKQLTGPAGDSIMQWAERPVE